MGWNELSDPDMRTANFEFSCDVYHEGVYYNEQSFLQLQTDILHFQSRGHVLICGDLNARTGREIDYVNIGDNNHISNNTTFHSSLVITPRNNYDSLVNTNGKQVLKLCKGLGLYIINGRTRGDSLGRFTYCSRLGASVVDYSITDIDPNFINAFIVRPQLPISDHCQTVLYLNQSIDRVSTAPLKHEKLFPLKPKLRGNQSSAEQFKENMSSSVILNILDHFMSTDFTPDTNGINAATSNLNNIFQTLATISNTKPPNKHRTNKQKIKKNMWFDNECTCLRKDLRQLSNKKHKEPANQTLRLAYSNCLKNYKKLICNKRDQYYEAKIYEIDESIDQNNFWNLFKKFESPKLRPFLQSGTIWRSYFKTLSQQLKPDLNQPQTNIKRKLEELQKTIKNYQNPLDMIITTSEITEHIKKLKLKKACGQDNTSNEMLKLSSPYIIQALANLFNLILSSGDFPETWAEGLLTPIYKKGDKFDPSNYRCICVGSNLAKLFCNIMNNRIVTFLTKGFLPKQRTSDHIYSLHTLINKNLKGKQRKIFTCFVDLKKAFDSVWHDGLLYKLLQIGIGGKTFDVIQSMYRNSRCAVKIGHLRTAFFQQGRGVRQRCSLSPTLFNIYINELAEALDRSGNIPGITLHDSEVKCLLYVDDLVLMSPTAEGLQHSLALLEQYCEEWALTVNLDKTRVMVFQKKARSQGSRYQFSYGGEVLEHSTCYSYLGIQISASGGFSLAVKVLYEKARRAFYAIKSRFGQLKLKSKNTI